MGKPVALDRIGQGLDHRLLADQLIEALRAVFAGEDAVGLGGFGGHGPNLGRPRRHSSEMLACALSDRDRRKRERWEPERPGA